MKDYLADLLRTRPPAVDPRNLVREYLQARILGALQRAGAMVPLAFHGGTALRFLYAAPRYSEDLDFALEGRRSLYDFRSYLKEISAEMSAEGYDIDFKANDAKTVHSAFVRFPGLLAELGLSGHRREALSVKLEIDTRPPAGATLETTVVRRYVTLQLQHHDRTSLLAGKLNAVLTRLYLKGRDLYDLMWYLADPTWPAPNLVLLNNALAQFGRQGKELTSDNWRETVRNALSDVAWEEAARDVAPFIERPGEAELLTKDNFERLLGG